MLSSRLRSNNITSALFCFAFLNSYQALNKFSKVIKFAYDKFFETTILPPPPDSGLSQTLFAEEIPILKKAVDLYKTYYLYLELFPKKDKHALGATCEKYLIQTIELLLEASYQPKEFKKASLLNANNKFETLKILIRLLRELNILEQKKYIILQSIIQEIGRMLGGWLKKSSPTF